MAQGRQVPGPRRRLRALHGRDGRARRGGTPSVDGSVRGLSGSVWSTRERNRSDAAARAAGQLGQQPSRLPGRSEGGRRPGRFGQGAERALAEHPLVPRRFSGSRTVEHDHPYLRGRGRRSNRPPRRQEPALRDPRALDRRALGLARQPLPPLDPNKHAPASGLARGAYILGDAPTGKPEVILIASGSEVSLAVEAHEQLLADGIRSRVVSLPSWDIFEHQTQEYRDSVLPPSVTARVAVEQASTLGWERYVGTSGRVIGMQTFRASAPLKELQKKFGFQPDRVAAAAREQLGR